MTNLMVRRQRSYPAADFSRTMEMTRATERRIIQTFLEKGSSHSRGHQTLGLVIAWCEEHKIAYRLTSIPGSGYFIEPYREG